LEGTLDTPVADWDTKRAWQDHAFEELAKVGYIQSSAYTMVRKDKAGDFVYRNSVWHGCDLLGTGVASFGHLNGVHMQNVDGWGEYLARVGAGELPLGRAFVTTERERLIRETILQMKLGKLAVAPFRDKFGVDILAEFAPVWERLAAEGMLTLAPESVHLTRAGLLRVDSLLPEFYQPMYQNARYT
jgi:oxygen-independent coproporphyrinogen III oxidase